MGMRLRVGSCLVLVVALGGCTSRSPARTAAQAPPPRSTSEHGAVAPKKSFLERTGPRLLVKDVPHVDTTVTRREGPASLEAALRVITVIATHCYTDDIQNTPLIIFHPEPMDVPITMTIDTRVDGTMSEVSFAPDNAPVEVAMCLAHALAAQPLHTERGPKHVVLAFNAHVWWSLQ